MTSTTWSSPFTVDTRSNGASARGARRKACEKVGAVIVQLVKGAAAENVATSKDLTSLAAELHVVSELSTGAADVQQLVGGVHLRNVAGDYVVNAPIIVLGGGVGKFNGGGSSINLNGGPITITGSLIAIEAAGIVKLASDLKIG